MNKVVVVPRHSSCDLPVGVSKVKGLPLRSYSKCVLSFQHYGPCQDKDGNRETMFKRYLPIPKKV